MGNEFTRLDEGGYADPYSTSAGAPLSRPRSPAGPATSGGEPSPTPPLTPMTLDTVLTVDHLKRLLKIVAYS
ncbi:MAG: hypothetical protein HQM02_01405 [Magnetococcales bacterium]|nr:hypothetical protein [Magnetococcales bacterium]